MPRKLRVQYVWPIYHVMTRRMGWGNYYAAERRAGKEVMARRIIQERLAQAGCTLRALRARRKGDKVKVELAEQLCAETTVSLKWVAQERGGPSDLCIKLVKRTPPQKMKMNKKVSIVGTDPFLTKSPNG